MSKLNSKLELLQSFFVDITRQVVSYGKGNFCTQQPGTFTLYIYNFFGIMIHALCMTYKKR